MATDGSTPIPGYTRKLMPGGEMIEDNETGEQYPLSKPMIIVIDRIDALECRVERLLKEKTIDELQNWYPCKEEF